MKLSGNTEIKAILVVSHKLCYSYGWHLLIPFMFVCHIHILEQNQSWKACRLSDYRVTDATFNSGSLLQNGKTILVGSRLGRSPVQPPAQRAAIYLDQVVPGFLQLNFSRVCWAAWNTFYPLLSIQLCLAASCKCCFSSLCCAPLRRVSRHQLGCYESTGTPSAPSSPTGWRQLPRPGGHRLLQPLPDCLHCVSVCSGGRRELDAVLQMWLHKRQKEGNNHFLRPAGSALVNAIQYPLAFIVHAHTRT